MKELILIQSELKAPKSQYNSFGRYKFRSAEDILEALKPLLLKHECTLTIHDEMVMIGERVYVKAIAILGKGSATVQTTAFAREPEAKKGMDASQVTGAASSYARKYALNGMFLIDDTKDADATNKHEEEQKLTKGTVIARIEKCSSIDEMKSLWTQVQDKDKEELQEMFAGKKKELS